MICTKCTLIQAFHSNLRTFLNSWILLQTNLLHLPKMGSWPKWGQKTLGFLHHWINPHGSLCWFLDQQPSCNYVRRFWLSNQSYQISMHHYVQFVGAWTGMEVFKPWTNECYWDYVLTILVITKFWIHICKPSNHDQTTLLYIQESWYSWQLGFGLTFKGNFGFTNIFLKLTIKLLRPC